MAIKAAFIRQGTTPVLTINVAGQDLSDTTVYVTIEQSDVQITKSNYNHYDAAVQIETTESEGIVSTTLLVYMAQSDTLRLRPGHAKVQIRWITEDGTADTSDIGRLEIRSSLFKGVIVHG